MNVEQVFFLQNVEEFNKLKDRKERNNFGVSIVDKFIKKSSKYELNLGNENRQDLVETVELIMNEDSILPSNLFDQIYSQILVDIKAGKIKKNNLNKLSLRHFSSLLFVGNIH